MDEERFAREVKKGKRFNYICFSVLICFILVVAVAVIYYINRPLSDSITVEGAENALSGSGILAKTDSSYYEIDGSSEFKTCLS